MNNFLNALDYIVSMVKQNTMFVLMLLSFLWIFNIINWTLFRSRLNVLGIYPRTVHGLVGIIFSPFLHGNFNHLFFNTIPLFMLLNFVLIGGMKEFYCISLTIMGVSGLAVWLLGRRAFHIGASSLIMGYWGYLLANAYQHPTAYSFILALVTLYYFGGLVLSLFPTQERVSWEGHLFGALAGIVAASLCPGA